MTLDGWRGLVRDAIRRDAAGDGEIVELIARVLHEQDAAKNRLRQKGYGWIGLPIVETVDLVPDAARTPRGEQ